MPGCAILGAQWGDEGKGKIVDLLARRAHMVVRFQGGANAGHTIHHRGKVLVLHQVPSGILRPGCVNLVANGCVLDPILLVDEILALRGLGVQVEPSNLGISERAHVVTPLHRHLDSLSGSTIGTTGRGIGPCYTDKARRVGIRMESLAQGNLLPQWERLLEYHASALDAVDPSAISNLRAAGDSLQRAASFLAPFIRDIRHELHRADSDDRNILLEGAQGALLDLDHGTYPFVTSSNTTIGGAYTGTGVHLRIQHRIAVLKAYTTRVGNGPFPTELHGSIGQRLRRVGNEYGATTGRPRRCGWLDLPILTESAMANGFTAMALTKLDCLTGMDPIRVATGRTPSGDPSYQDLAGWTADISTARAISQLPSRCRAYLNFLERHTEIPISILSLGPARDQTLLQEPPW